MKYRTYVIVLAAILLIAGADAVEKSIKGISSQVFVPKKKILPPQVSLPPQILLLGKEKNMVAAGMNIASQMKPELAKELAKARGPVLKAYKEMEKDKQFASLPCMLPGTPEYKKNISKGHYFLYVPKSWKAGNQSVLIVFLHGFGGNFQVFPWWWKDMCEKKGWIMAFPTFGMGFWNNEGSDTLVKGVIKDVRRKTGLKKGKVFLAGISNGSAALAELTGKGVKAHGVIVISGGLPDLTVLPKKISLPVLILTGEQDWAHNNSAVTAMALKQLGHPTTLKTYPDQGHFLFALQTDACITDIGKWIAGDE